MAALVVRRQAPTPRQCAYISAGYRIRPYGPHANWHLPSAGRCKHRPLQNGSRGHLAPEGSNGRGRKGVKKNAALLHFLAFAFSDHIFGVPRGEQPLGRGSLPRNSETFFASFFGHKKGRTTGSMTSLLSAPPQGGGKRKCVQQPGHPSPAARDRLRGRPLCRCATSPHTVGSHPSRGASNSSHQKDL